ncbi:MAG TPA: PIN domain-containing protein [Candidatus Omnitrophota bacterium]|nr:PIN domain-containing protein [Candidatus Omnitrophota bacterium]
MVLVDTTIWVSHLRKGHERLQVLLEEAEVATHPMIIGELACGRIHQRREILNLLQTLPQVTLAEHEEVLAFIEKKGLMGLGIGYIDAHLLACAVLSETPLWTEDLPLKHVANILKIGY